MTDRYCGVYVTLAADMRDDDAQSTIDAIKHIKGVMAVTPQLAGYDTLCAEVRAIQNCTGDLLELVGKWQGSKKTGDDR